MRSSFAPTLWTSEPAPGQTLKQVWFTGVHADVGGGYKEMALSDICLRWMIGEAAELGASFDDNMVAQIQQPDPQGVLHDSLSGFFKFIGSQPRSMPCLDGGASSPPWGQRVDVNVQARRMWPPISQAPYRPTVKLASGQMTTVRVYAREYWNESGLFLEAGATYRFEVDPKLTWKDWTYVVNAEGYDGNLIQWLFTRFKRVQDAKWFCLCGAIADAVKPAVSGDPPAITVFPIGTAETHECRQSGYLYLFANDMPGFYFNNRGSLSVMVTRTG